jgi:hypothetical protein
MSKETKPGGLQASNEAAISGRADVCKPQGRSSGLSEAVLLPHSLVLFCVPTSWCKACEFREVAWLLISTHERRAASSRACSCGFGARKVLLRLETTLARSKTSYRLGWLTHGFTCGGRRDFRGTNCATQLSPQNFGITLYLFLFCALNAIKELSYPSSNPEKPK